ncbi:MAG: glycine oxidase ThiO [Betaproteobacteria bacterium]|nr:glycine oxidase ThiO [Betaproteobacteria bacterium]
MTHPTPDILLIGAGAVGMVSALALARAGAKVTLLERGETGRESSWAGGGILSPLPHWNFREEVTRLTIQGEAMWPQTIANLKAATGLDPQYRKCGMLLLPEYDEAKGVAWCRAHKVPLEQISARTREPALGYDTPALLLPEVAQVRNPRLLQTLRRAVELAGITLREHTEVIGWRVENDRVTGVETNVGVLSAGQYMVCGGAWNQMLAGDLALGLKVWPVRGQIVLFQAAPDLLSTVILRNSYYLIPRQGGLILAGTTRENVGFDKSTTESARAEITAQAWEILPALRTAPVVKHWAGLRPGSEDNIPVISAHPRITNLYANAGHFRYGVTMAPLVGELAVNLLLHRPQPLDMTPYLWPPTA